MDTGVASVTSINDMLELLLVPARDEVAVGREAGGVAVGEDERAGLAIEILEARGEGVSIPVGLEEHVRDVDPSGRAVELAAINGSGEAHVVPEVGQAGRGVVARGEVDVDAHGRGVAVAVLEGETRARALVVRVLDTGRGAIGASGPARRVEVTARAGDLDRLDRAFGRVQLSGSGRRGSSPQLSVAADNLQTEGKGLDVVVGGIEAGEVSLCGSIRNPG